MLDKNLSSRSKVLVYLVLLAIASLLIIPFLYMISIALASPEISSKHLLFYQQSFIFQTLLNCLKIPLVVTNQLVYGF